MKTILVKESKETVNEYSRKNKKYGVRKYGKKEYVEYRC